MDLKLRNTYVASVNTWNGNKRTWSAAASTGDLHLSAGEVELRAAVALSDVKGDSFHADEVSEQCNKKSIQEY